MERFATNATPLIRNQWYVAALGTELHGEYVQRQILERSLLLLRDPAGRAVALANRCPHRSFPLSRGTIDGDTITCGYHGIQFRLDGRCLRVPSQSSVPSALRLRSYPVVESGPLVWVWMGDPTLAALTPVPETPWLTDSAYATVADRLFLECSYIRLHENAMDLTHLPFVHGAGAIGWEFAEAKADVEAVGSRVRSSVDMPAGPLPPFLTTVLGRESAGAIRHTDAWFDSPGLHYALAGYHLNDSATGEPSVHRLTFLHAFTPATRTTTHHFWAVSRDGALDDAAIDTLVLATQRRIYGAYVDALRQIEAESALDGGAVEEFSITADHPGLLVRRHLAMMAAAEASTGERVHTA